MYGTLLSGEGNHHFLQDSIYLGNVKTKPGYELFDLGAFPAMIKGGATSVRGEIYEVDRITLMDLDFLEGHPSFYYRTSIQLDNGEIVQTYLQSPEQVEGLQRISSGDWRNR